MTSNISKKIFENIWFYLIFIPFLIPLGPENYIAWYKDFYTGWMEISTILMALSLLILCMGGFLKIDKAILFLLLYHIVFLLITIVEQHTITNGFQKLLSTPILILYINEKSKNNSILSVPVPLSETTHLTSHPLFHDSGAKEGKRFEILIHSTSLRSHMCWSVERSIFFSKIFDRFCCLSVW